MNRAVPFLFTVATGAIASCGTTTTTSGQCDAADTFTCVQRCQTDAPIEAAAVCSNGAFVCPPTHPVSRAKCLADDPCTFSAHIAGPCCLNGKEVPFECNPNAFTPTYVCPTGATLSSGGTCAADGGLDGALDAPGDVAAQ